LDVSDQVRGVGYSKSEVETDVADLELEMDVAALELETAVTLLDLEMETDMYQEISK
jgi:hypothetical protein